MKFVYRILLIGVVFAFTTCAENKNPGVPDNAINPDVMKNPATASSSKDNGRTAEIKFEEEAFDFGTIKEGEKVSHDFKFKNTGKGDLIISSATASCGCTVPEWPKDPIPPGGNGIIKVSFNSEGKSGMQHKNVTILSNTVPSTKVLNINGEVLPSGKQGYQ